MYVIYLNTIIRNSILYFESCNILKMKKNVLFSDIKEESIGIMKKICFEIFCHIMPCAGPSRRNALGI